MTAITSAHVEWAVVDRLRAMLDDPPHARYNVTQAYGLCMAILAWVVQRIRTPEEQVDTLEAKAAIAVKQQLEEQRIKSPPWNLQRISANGKESPAIPTDISAFDFLVWLRNASCHGDARTVCAVNNGNRLVGFGFQNKLNGKTTYSCVLKEVEIRRIGRSLASLYCEAFQEASGQSLGFTDEAVRERVEHATTDRH